MNKRTEHPNIVMVIVHDLGQYLGCYGYGIKTPNLDRLAASGARFDNYHCTAAQCSPSRGSIMTGKYPHVNGLVGLSNPGWKWEYFPGVKKLPEYLGELGYASYLFGHQHESQDPASLGYTEVIDAAPGKYTHSGQPIVDAFIERVPELAASGQPFYACVGLFEPHRPYGLEGYDNDAPEEVSPLPWLPDRPGIREDIAGLNGMVYAVDQWVGKMLQSLEQAGVRENTLFIFTTDHGLAMPRAKGTCYDAGTKTALLWSLPGRIQGEMTHDALLSNVDLLPTLVEFAGGEAPAEIDGRSFLGLLEGGCDGPREDLYIEFNWHEYYVPMRAVRTRRHKYIRHFSDGPMVFIPGDIYFGAAGKEMRDEYYATDHPAEELYDLEADPFERHNLAGDPEHEGVLVALRDQVQRWMEQTDDRTLRGPWPPAEGQQEPPPHERPSK